MTDASEMNEQLLEQQPVAPENVAEATYDIPVRRTVLVTGGAEGIGPAICKKMADQGHFVAATYHDKDKARAWQDQMEKEGYLIFIYDGDASGPEESRDLVGDIIEDLGPIHILINNAGIDESGSFPHVTRAALENMLENGYGRIVNIPSVGGQEGAIDQVRYAAARADMHEFTKVLAQEAARRGVTVNTISPGYVANDMILAMPEDIRSRIEAQIPVGRLGRPEDVAHVVSFLVADESGFITGANIAADGGYFMD